MRAHALKAPQGRCLGIRKLRCLKDKVWEGTEREYVYGQSGIVKVTEGWAFRGLLSRPSATSWSYVPATSPRLQEGTLLPQSQTLFLRILPPPHPRRPVQKYPASMRWVHAETGSTPTLSRGWAWQGLHMGLSQHPTPAQDPALQSLPWGTDTPKSPPCCLLPISCCPVLVSWLPLDPPESSSSLSSIPLQRTSRGLISCGLHSGCFSLV